MRKILCFISFCFVFSPAQPLLAATSATDVAPTQCQMTASQETKQKNWFQRTAEKTKKSFGFVKKAKATFQALKSKLSKGENALASIGLILIYLALCVGVVSLTLLLIIDVSSTFLAITGIVGVVGLLLWGLGSLF